MQKMPFDLDIKIEHKWAPFQFYSMWMFYTSVWLLISETVSQKCATYLIIVALRPRENLFWDIIWYTYIWNKFVPYYYNRTNYYINHEKTASKYIRTFTHTKLACGHCWHTRYFKFATAGSIELHRALYITLMHSMRYIFPFHRWVLGMNKWFHPTLYNWCDYSCWD